MRRASPRLLSAARGNEQYCLGLDRVRQPGFLRNLPRAAESRCGSTRKLCHGANEAIHRARRTHVRDLGRRDVLQGSIQTGSANVIAVIFEAVPHPGQTNVYLDAAAALRPQLEKIDGFISIERFESLVSPGKILSLSYWRDEEAVRRWRNLEAHRRIQAVGRKSIFADY